ncbi:MAG: hypothetical protein QM504_05435 [Pseudomonadota bacterium]
MNALIMSSTDYWILTSLSLGIGFALLVGFFVWFQAKKSNKHTN